MTVRLAAQEIELRYDSDSPPALTQFTLAVRAGELIGIVGPNGSGKSTLVRALSRALRPARGAVLLDGADLYGHMSARRSAQSVAAVPQNTSVAFEFTVREIVRMGRSPHLPRRPFAGETTEDEQIVEDALRLAGVWELAERAMPTLSGGEQQRVVLARALAQETDILLLDEPTAHLDIHHQTQTLALVQSLAHAQGKAVLAVLHDLNLAAAYCDRLTFLKEGKIIAQGTPAEVLTAENVRRAYGARVWVRCHPTTGRPMILSLPDVPIVSGGTESSHARVHVICGGGTGAGLLFALRQRGYAVTVGALNGGDTDEEACGMLGIECARESPFSALSPDVLARARALALDAEAVILTDVPFGRANLANLEAALEFRRQGVPVICIQPTDGVFRERDFTEGAANLMWELLLTEGATVAADADAAFADIMPGV